MYNKGGTGYIVSMYVQRGGNRIYCCTYIPTIYPVPSLLCIHTCNISCSPIVVHTYLQYILFPPRCTYIPTIYHVPSLLYIHTYNISCSTLVVHTYLQYILFPPCCTCIPTIYPVPPSNTKLPKVTNMGY